MLASEAKAIRVELEHDSLFLFDMEWDGTLGTLVVRIYDKERQAPYLFYNWSSWSTWWFDRRHGILQSNVRRP
jgi:hypothetical protein